MSASFWKSALIPAVAALLITVFASPPAHAVAYPGPDSYGYFAQAAPWNLREPGDILIADDDAYTSTPLPFTFRFYGMDYDTLYVSTNGFVAFTDPGDDGCCDGEPLPGSGFGNLIAPYWTDLVTYVYTKTRGVAGSREFIISWVGTYYNSSEDVLVQLVLHENRQTIEFQYGPALSDYSHDVSVGIENASQTDGLQIDYGYVSFENQAFLISPPPLVQLLYVNNDASPSNFISVFSVADDGTLTDLGDVPTGGSGTPLSYYAAERLGLAIAGSYLFAANSESGTITTFAIDPTNGNLMFVGVPETIGATGNWATAIAATPDGNYLIATSAQHGFVVVLSIDPLTGALTLLPASQTPVPWPDSIRVSPDGNFVAVSDGVAGIHVFSFAGGILTPVAGSPFPAPLSSTGLAFNMTGTLLFNGTGNSTGTNVAVFGFDTATGQLAPIAGSPFEFPGAGLNSNVVLLGPDEAQLFVSNQDSHTITTLNVAGDGSLSLQTTSASGCCGPAGMARNAAGTLLFSANWFGGVSSYAVAPDGSLALLSNLPASASVMSLVYWSSGAIVPPLMLDPIDDQSVVWGDELTVTASATGGSGSYTYSLAPGAPAGAAIDGSTGEFSWTPTSGQLAGSPYTITVQVDDGSETDTEDFVVTVEKREVAFTFPSTNPTAVPVTAPGGTSEAFTMCASFTDNSDGTGDLALATPVTFTFTPLTGGAPTTLTATITGSGSSRTACVSSSGFAVDAYDVTVNMGGDYYTGSRSTVFAVYDPSLGFTTGGGTVIHNGYVANFAFNVKYLKNKNIQGGAIYIEHRPDGEWKVKSNSLQSLSIAGSTATIVSKATVNGTGNNLMIVSATDEGTPGVGVDLYGLQVRNSSGTVIASLSFDPMTIAGGNIQVPHKTGKK